MAGRILNRQARTKVLFNLLALAEQAPNYDSLAAIMDIGRTALDAGPDVERVREACNARRLIFIETKKKENKIRELFPDATINTVAGRKNH